MILTNKENVMENIDKELGIMVKVRGADVELHLFPDMETMERWRGQDSEVDAESTYKGWLVPFEIFEQLAVMGGNKF